MLGLCRPVEARVFFDKNYTFPGASGVHKATGGWDSNVNQEYILQRIHDWLNLYSVGVGVKGTARHRKSDHHQQSESVSDIPSVIDMGDQNKRTVKSLSGK